MVAVYNCHAAADDLLSEHAAAERRTNGGNSAVHDLNMRRALHGTAPAAGMSPIVAAATQPRAMQYATSRRECCFTCMEQCHRSASAQEASPQRPHAHSLLHRALCGWLHQ